MQTTNHTASNGHMPKATTTSGKPKKGAVQTRLRGKMPKPGTAAAFVMSMPLDVPRADVVKAAHRAGYRGLTEAAVSTHRWTYRDALAKQQGAAAAAPKPTTTTKRAAKAEVPAAPTYARIPAVADEYERQLRRLVMRMGWDQAQALMAKLAVEMED